MGEAVRLTVVPDEGAAEALVGLLRSEGIDCFYRDTDVSAAGIFGPSTFGGWREFNPLAVVFRPFRRTRTFRFWQPFRDFKHGHPEALHRMESEFFGLIGVHRHDPSA